MDLGVFLTLASGGSFVKGGGFLFVGGAGNVAVTTIGGDEVTFNAVPVGTVLPVQADYLDPTGAVHDGTTSYPEKYKVSTPPKQEFAGRSEESTVAFVRDRRRRRARNRHKSCRRSAQ